MIYMNITVNVLDYHMFPWTYELDDLHDENIKIQVIKIILIYKPGDNELPQAHREWWDT